MRDIWARYGYPLHESIDSQLFINPLCVYLLREHFDLACKLLQKQCGQSEQGTQDRAGAQLRQRFSPAYTRVKLPALATGHTVAC